MRKKLLFQHYAQGVIYGQMAFLNPIGFVVWYLDGDIAQLGHLTAMLTCKANYS
jgi:hypothetical protein